MAESKETFTVRGVDSESDVQEINDELERANGIMGFDIDEEGNAEALYDEDIISGEQVKKTVSDMGYDVE